jgi:hypothetical protein
MRYVYEGNVDPNDGTVAIGVDDERVGIGQEIELTDEQFEEYKDRFVLTPTEAPKAEEPEAEK